MALDQRGNGATLLAARVNPQRALAKIAKSAEGFLLDRGFVRGQPFLVPDHEAITFATKVQIELSVRTDIGARGFYGFSVKCSNYRSWEDGFIEGGMVSPIDASVKRTGLIFAPQVPAISIN